VRVAGLVFVLALLGLAGDLLAGEKPNASGGEIRVETGETRLLAGVDEGTSIKAIVPSGATEISFVAARGKIDTVIKESAKRYTAVYHCPDEFYPQVEIIGVMAVVEGVRTFGYTALLLYGQGEAEVKTRRGAEAIILIDEKKFGPVKANNKGKAKIQVEVPPGVHFGRDDRDREINLHVPGVARTAVFSQTSKILRGSLEPVDLFGVVFKSNGNLDLESKILVEANVGKVEDVQSMKDGIFKAIYYPPEQKSEETKEEDNAKEDDDVEDIRIEAFIAEKKIPSAEIQIAYLEPPEPTAVVETTEETVSEEQVEDTPELEWLYATPLIGFAWNFGSIRTFNVSADFGVRLPILEQQFLLGIELGFLTNQVEPTVETASESEAGDGKATTWFVPMTAVIGWRKPLPGGFGLFVSGQIGVTLVDNTIEVKDAASNTMDVEETSYCFTVGANIGAELEIGPGALLLGLRYLWFKGELMTMDEKFSFMFVDVGYRFWFL
jgi:hypothetical protein